MAQTYREVAIDDMLRIQLAAAIDSVESVKKALDRELHEMTRKDGPI